MFTNHEVSYFLVDLGTIHQTSCAHSSQQNGGATRKHQHIFNTARALKFQSHLFSSFWDDFILIEAHIIHLSPAKSLNFKSPFELLSNKPPDYSHLRAFGCLCYATTVTSYPDKLSPRAIKGIFLCYPYC